MNHNNILLKSAVKSGLFFLTQTKMKNTLENLTTTIANVDYDLRADWSTDQQKREMMLCKQQLMIAKANLEACAELECFQNNTCLE